MTHFSLTWKAHKQNICEGLSGLQQRGEFVDMTLAADGHHVKVHQMMMSLASPYIKDILSTSNGSHPVIFLNKTSYTTLCALLEYIYTGEVLIAKEYISELITVGQELHICGLKDMKIDTEATDQKRSQTKLVLSEKEQPFAMPSTQNSLQDTQYNNTKTTDIVSGNYDINDDDHGFDDDNANNDDVMEPHNVNTVSTIKNSQITRVPAGPTEGQVQYTISNQGALQMILNRYMYYLRYTSRKRENGHRQWRCLNYVAGKDKKIKTKCMACVVTKDDMVIKRHFAHNHDFHDAKIMKKIRMNAVFTTLSDASQMSAAKKQERDQYRNFIDVQNTESVDIRTME